MNYIDAVYEKMEQLKIRLHCRKIRKDGNFVVVMSHNLETFYFTDTAAEIIELIKDQSKIALIYSSLQSLYDVDSSQLKNDLIQFIKDMQWKGIVSLSV